MSLDASCNLRKSCVWWQVSKNNAAASLRCGSVWQRRDVESSTREGGKIGVEFETNFSIRRPKSCDCLLWSVDERVDFGRFSVASCRTLAVWGIENHEIRRIVIGGGAV